MKISPAQRLAALTRQRLGPASGRRAPAAASTGLPAAAELLGRQIASLDAADPDRGHKALRCFFESVLRAELGAEVSNDPAFQGLVDQVHGALRSDPDTAAQLELAARHLLGED